MYAVAGYAPWILYVAASYTDRRIIDKVPVEDQGTILHGAPINAFSSSSRDLPLVYGKEVTNTCSEKDARECLPWCLESSKVKQKVVLCDSVKVFKLTAKKGDAFGYIMPNEENNASHVTPPSHVAAISTNDMNLVKAYRNQQKSLWLEFSKVKKLIIQLSVL